LHRIFHYTGTDPGHFQNFVIFTNYQFYVDVFGRLGHEHMASGRSGFSPTAICGLWAPIPALAEMQVALELAVGEVTGLAGFELKRVMRTGTVASVSSRARGKSGGDFFVEVGLRVPAHRVES
jgi:hypothetical protein